MIDDKKQIKRFGLDVDRETISHSGNIYSPFYISTLKTIGNLITNRLSKTLNYEKKFIQFPGNSLRLNHYIFMVMVLSLYLTGCL